MREWILGRNPVYEVLRAGRRTIHRLWIAQGLHSSGHLQEIIQVCSADKIPIQYIQRPQLDKLGDHHQGVALEVGAYLYSSSLEMLGQAATRNEPPFILILDMIQDPQNMGTLLRTAEVVGVHGIMIPLRRTATITPAVVSASAGASEHLLVEQVNLAQAIGQLQAQGIWVIGLENNPQAKLPDQLRLDGPLALVVGNEGEGMRPLVRQSCDLLMKIPMRGKLDSLNAAVAGSIALYLAWQARGFLRS